MRSLPVRLDKLLRHLDRVAAAAADVVAATNLGIDRGDVLDWRLHPLLRRPGGLRLRRRHARRAAALAIGQVYGATGVGVVLAAWMVPFLGFILFGGVFADRIGARPLMLGADLVRLIAQGVVAVAFFTGTPS